MPPPCAHAIGFMDDTCTHHKDSVASGFLWYTNDFSDGSKAPYSKAPM